MRRSRFTESEIVGYLKEAEAGVGVSELCRRIGIAETTFYRWKKRYGGLEVDQAKKLKAIEEENRRLKRLVADQALNIQVLKDALGKEW
jgi:putative transposase